MRFAFCPHRGKFSKEFLNWVDFVAVIPYFIALAASGGKRVTSLGWLRILRMIRVVRLFRVSKHSKRIQIMMRVLQSCTSDFQMLLACIFLFMIFGGSIIYFFEEGSADTLFTSILIITGHYSWFDCRQCAKKCPFDMNFFFKHHEFSRRLRFRGDLSNICFEEDFRFFFIFSLNFKRS